MFACRVVVCRAVLTRERGGPALYRRAWCRRRMSGWGSRGGSFRSGRRRVSAAGTTGSSPQARSVRWGRCSRQSASGSGRLGGGEGVETAARDLAGGGEGRSLGAGSFADASVELEVGAAVAAGVLGGFDERPPELGRAGLGEPAAALAVGGVDDDRVEAGGADELA